MSHFLSLRIRGLVLITTLIVIPALSGQETKAPTTAPVPPQIGSARNVFIANGGADLAAEAAFKRAGDPYQAYDHFYAAMQSWGRYTIVATPAEADLVFEVRFAAPMYYDGNLVTYEPQFRLRILDTKTHFLLWSLSEPVEGAFRKATWDKNFSHGLELLMDDLKKLSSPVSADASKK